MDNIRKLYLALAVAIIALVGLAIAVVPPPPANQMEGIYDTSVVNFNESLCRDCHDSGVPDRHHQLVPGGEWGCMDCHPVVTDGGYSVLRERNCVMCHNGTAFYANPAAVNISRPHHVNHPDAAARNCSACHGSYVADYDDGHYVPSYGTSMVTPLASYIVYNGTSDRYWGGCFACHQNSSSASPLILTNHDTHHYATGGQRGGEIDHQGDNTPGRECNWCHVINVSSGRPLEITTWLGIDLGREVMELRNSTLLGIGDTLNGTGCQKCHSVASIHNIQYDYTNTSGQLGYGHIGDNWDCNGCHASWDAGAAPMQGAIIPSVTSITPGKLTTGVDAVVTIVGSNFLSGNGVYTSVISVDGSRLTPSSITDSQIVVTVPGLAAGVHTIQVVKTGDVTDKMSKLSTLVVVTPVDVASASLVKEEITITGTGFGAQPTLEFTDLGVFIDTTVGKNKKMVTTTIKADIVSWTDSEIVVTAEDVSVGEKLTVKALSGEDSATITEGEKKKNKK